MNGFSVCKFLVFEWDSHQANICDCAGHHLTLLLHLALPRLFHLLLAAFQPLYPRDIWNFLVTLFPKLNCPSGSLFCTVDVGLKIIFVRLWLCMIFFLCKWIKAFMWRTERKARIWLRLSWLSRQIRAWIHCVLNHLGNLLNWRLADFLLKSYHVLIEGNRKRCCFCHCLD